MWDWKWLYVILSLVVSLLMQIHNQREDMDHSKPCHETKQLNGRRIRVPDRRPFKVIENSDHTIVESKIYATGDQKYNTRCPALLCPCFERIGNMIILLRMENSPFIVAGPFWPFMVNMSVLKRNLDYWIILLLSFENTKRCLWHFRVLFSFRRQCRWWLQWQVN